jgi:hypothetical protein
MKIIKTAKRGKSRQKIKKIYLILVAFHLELVYIDLKRYVEQIKKLKMICRMSPFIASLLVEGNKGLLDIKGTRHKTEMT